MTEFCHQVIQLQSDVEHLHELLHEHVSDRVSYDDCPSAWLILYRHYTEQLEYAETQLARLVRRDSKDGAPQVLQTAP